MFDKLQACHEYSIIGEIWRFSGPNPSYYMPSERGKDNLLVERTTKITLLVEIKGSLSFANVHLAKEVDK